MSNNSTSNSNSNGNSNSNDRIIRINIIWESVRFLWNYYARLPSIRSYLVGCFWSHVQAPARACPLLFRGPDFYPGLCEIGFGVGFADGIGFRF